MANITDELFEKSRALQLDRPSDLSRLQKRMGTRNQNGSIEIYAYIDLSSTVDLLFQLEKAALNEDYELKTVIKIAVDWLEFIASRAVPCFQLEDLSGIIQQVITELKAYDDRKKTADLLRATEHYVSQIRYWLDLEFPWPEVGSAYAAAKGDPPPNPV